MDKQTHTPEPWLYGNAKLRSDGTDILLDYGHYIAHIGRIISIGENDEKIASYIVACVNYCKGATNQELEAGSLEQLKAERDELCDEVDHANRANERALAKIAELESERDNLLKEIEKLKANG